MEYRVALITGAGSGIGRELALQLARGGCAIAAIDCNQQAVEALAGEIRQLGGKMEWRCADVTDAATLKQRVAELDAFLGPIDLMIACAGIGIETSALNYRAEDMNAVLGVNLIGVSNTLAAVLPGMIERRRGQVVALSSLASFRGMPRMLGYCASKSGLNALMEAIRVELGPRGIVSTTICPGWIRTPMTAPIGGKIPNMLEADDAARRILKAIRAKRAFYAFPASMVWPLKIIGWLPRFLRDGMFRRMMRDMKPRDKPAQVDTTNAVTNTGQAEPNATTTENPMTGEAASRNSGA